MRRIAPVVLALAFAAACSSGGTTSTPPPAGTSPQREQIGGIDAVVRGRLAVSRSTAAIEIQDNFFEPNLLTAPAGSTVTLNLSSKGATLHNFSVSGQKIDRDISSSGSASVAVKVPASGRLVFFCKYHRDESGMVGALDAS